MCSFLFPTTISSRPDSLLFDDSLSLFLTILLKRRLFAWTTDSGIVVSLCSHPRYTFPLSGVGGSRSICFFNVVHIFARFSLFPAILKSST